MTAVNTLLDRLERVRQRAPDQWSARCPAHSDKGPSLSIKVLPDGRILVHDFGGCSVDDVLGAVGLSLQDLFPRRPPPGGGLTAPPRRRLLTAGQALDLLHAEALIVAVVAADIGQSVSISEVDRERVLQAAGRIAVLRDEVTA